MEFNFNDYIYGANCVSIKYLKEEIDKKLLESEDPNKYLEYRNCLSDFYSRNFGE